MNRRKMMKGSVALGAAMIAGNMFAEEQKKKGIDNFIFINLKGGPSQLELFDGKPTSYNSGPTKHIKSQIPGVYFNKTMAGLREFSNNMAVFRMTSPERDHKRGQYYLQSGGNRPLSSLKHPGLSSVVGWAKGKSPEFPGSVAMGSFQGSGYLGVTHSGAGSLFKFRSQAAAVCKSDANIY